MLIAHFQVINCAMRSAVLCTFTSNLKGFIQAKAEGKFSRFKLSQLSTQLKPILSHFFSMIGG